MSPKAFAAALRDFAAAVALSPDPAKGVADLALLIAQSVDENFAEYESHQPGPSDHDEEAFPPLDDDPVVYKVGLKETEYTEAEVADLARKDAGLSTEAWAAMPAEEQSLHMDLQLAKLFRESD